MLEPEPRPIKKERLKRGLDLVMAMLAFSLLALPMVAIGLAIKMTSPGPVLYWSDRVGRHNRLFRMPKYRTMRVGTPAVASHLLSNPDQYVTPIGRFLRRTSLDELPQIFSVIKGDMSFVGPRPALYNQEDLIALRCARGIDRVRPGITGWAQINGRDELPIPVKVAFDEYYVRHRSLRLDVKTIWLTFGSVLRARGVDH